MRALDVDHLLVSNPVDVGYLTGFLGGDSYLLVGPRKPLILSDRRYEEDLEAIRDTATVKMRDGSMWALVAELVSKLSSDGKLERLGVQPEHMTLAGMDGLKAALRKAKVGSKSITTASGVVGSLRAVKDEGEIAAIRKAARVQEAAMLATRAELRPGMSEIEICAMLEEAMKSRGSSRPAFDTIVGAHANASRPHYHPAAAKTKNGKGLLIDWGASVDGYRSDMTRCFCFGKWPRELREIYGIVLDAHEAAAAALRPGARCADIDAVARDHIAKSGYGDNFGHSLGHGLGMDVHERPSLSRHAGDAELEEGHVVTIEPGIYLPGVGGVRIEDDYAITARGAKNLCSLPKDIDWATL